MKSTYVIEYLNEIDFKKKERALKKYNMLAYKKLFFYHYSELRKGIFNGIVVLENEKDKIKKYELELPTDQMFSKAHGNIVLHYSVYENLKMVMLDNITPEDVLTEGHQKELTTYKGVMVSKSRKERDMFIIDLLKWLNDKDK